MRCLRKQPEGRYATAGELADAIDRWRKGEVVVTVLEAPPKPVAKKRSWFAALWGKKSSE